MVYSLHCFCLPSVSKNFIENIFFYFIGGFGILPIPEWDELKLHFLNDFDGILAYPNVRGNGHENRGDWHELGRMFKKKNAFIDFQWAAKFLVEKKKYTEYKKIVIKGESHGGLLVATCINQAPELFGVAISMVPVTDMLR